ncbi:MAG TPA: hypothetical protein VMJ70_11030 [Candidatus Sulfotelmatobacter sp.]|nr:hypothetical protein [Candidatus Sulfotelmatobacter sp.]
MKTLNEHRRVISTLMMSLVAATLLAQTASAGNAWGHSKRWKPGPPAREIGWVAPPAPVYVVHHSDAGPIFAGLVGGLILGAALANAHPAVHVQYSYWDPYCQESFSSLAAYDAHLRYHHHPQFVRVIDASNGRCVRELSWSDRGWQPCEHSGEWHD